MLVKYVDFHKPFTLRFIKMPVQIQNVPLVEMLSILVRHWLQTDGDNQLTK